MFMSVFFSEKIFSVFMAAEYFGFIGGNNLKCSLLVEGFHYDIGFKFSVYRNAKKIGYLFSHRP